MNEFQNVKIVRSARKTVSLEIGCDLQIVLRAPQSMSDSDIQSFLEEKREWLEKHIAIMEKRKNEERQAETACFSETEIKAMIASVKQFLPPVAAHYAALMGVKYGRITVRTQKTLWGSCSSKGNLNFNCLLALCPPEVQNYVVIHELAHLKYLNHSADFWRFVEHFCPDFRAHRQWLKNNGNQFVRRLPK